MDSATLHDKIEQTVNSGKPKMYFDLLGTENLRCWLNVYMPGEGTAGLHYHHSDETFTVIEGSGEIVHRDGSRTQIEKGSVVLIPGKTLLRYQKYRRPCSCRAGQPGGSFRRRDDLFRSRAQRENERAETVRADLRPQPKTRRRSRDHKKRMACGCSTRWDQ